MTLAFFCSKNGQELGQIRPSDVEELDFTIPQTYTDSVRNNYTSSVRTIVSSYEKFS